jgi:hypothetical protein
LDHKIKKGEDMAQDKELILHRIEEIEKILDEINKSLIYKKLAEMHKETLAKATGVVIGNNEYIQYNLVPEIKNLLKKL